MNVCRSSLVAIAWFITASLRAGSVDPALIGTWYLEQGPKDGRTAIIIWKILPEAKLVMSFGAIEKGALSTNPERFGVTSPDNPNELFHGHYKIGGQDSFSTDSTDQPGEWVKWTKIARNATPKIEECLLAEVMAEPKGEAKGEFNHALVGIWQASMSDNRSSSETLWHIAASGQCVRVLVGRQNEAMPFVADNGQIKLTTPDGTVNEMKYTLGKDGLEVSDGQQALKFARCHK